MSKCKAVLDQDKITSIVVKTKPEAPAEPQTPQEPRTENGTSEK